MDNSLPRIPIVIGPRDDLPASLTMQSVQTAAQAVSGRGSGVATAATTCNVGFAFTRFPGASGLSCGNFTSPNPSPSPSPQQSGGGSLSNAYSAGWRATRGMGGAPLSILAAAAAVAAYALTAIADADVDGDSM